MLTKKLTAPGCSFYLYLPITMTTTRYQTKQTTDTASIGLANQNQAVVVEGANTTKETENAILIQARQITENRASEKLKRDEINRKLQLDKFTEDVRELKILIARLKTEYKAKQTELYDANNRYNTILYAFQMQCSHCWKKYSNTCMVCGYEKDDYPLGK
jgi:hypothetical protein